MKKHLRRRGGPSLLRTVLLPGLLMVLVARGGLAKPLAAAEANPYDEKTVIADTGSSQLAAIYSKDNPPATPAAGDFPLRKSASQYGSTWTFEKPARRTVH